MSSKKLTHNRQSRSKKSSQTKSARPPERAVERSDSNQEAPRNAAPTVVSVGASAGGQEAFTQLLRHLPADTGMAFVLVQHLDPERESALSDILSRATSLPVREVTSDQRVEPNHIYVIPPNAKLTTVNEEMASRNTELTRLNNDLVNLQTSTRLAILLLGRDLTIRRFSAQAEKQFNLLAGDIGRPIGRIRHNLDIADLGGMVEEVIVSVREAEREVRDKNGHCYSLRVCPYLTVDGKVDGAVLVLVNIDAIKRSERAQTALDFAQATVDTVREPLLVLDDELRVRSASRAFFESFRVTPGETIGRHIDDLGNGQWKFPDLRSKLKNILLKNRNFAGFKVEYEFPHLGQRTMLLNGRLLHQIDGSPQAILLTIEDLTGRWRSDLATVLLAAVVDSSDDAIIAKDLNGIITSWNGGAERLFGYMAHEAIGQPVIMLIPRERLDEADHITRFISLGLPCPHFETIRCRKDGTRRDVSLTISPIVDAQGDIVGSSGIVRDITERKRLQEEAASARVAKAVLRSGRNPLLILGDDLRVHTANEAFCHTFNIPLAECEGRLIYDLADGQWNIPRLRQALEDILPRNSSFENFEITADFEGIGQRTLLLNANKLSEGKEPQRILFGILDITEISQLKAAAMDSAARLQVLADNIPILCWTADANGSIDWYNQRWFDYTGTTLEEMRGWGWRAAHHPDHVDRVVTKIKRCFDTGEIWDDTFPLRSKDGEYRWFLSRAWPIRDERGRVVRWFGTNTDITERERSEQRQQLLMNELAHRGKNLLAVIQGIISRSLSGTRSLAEARGVLMQRVQALARSQTILVNEAFEGAPIAEIIRLEFEAFSGRVKAVGPDVMLNPRAAQTFALLIHELATNAIKYGSLSQPGGRIAINWSIEATDAEARFKFQWQERGGPPVAPPIHQGFGRILIEKVAAEDFGAQPRISYAPEGLSYEIDAPLLEVVAGEAAVLESHGGSIGDDTLGAK